MHLKRSSIIIAKKIRGSKFFVYCWFLVYGCVKSRVWKYMVLVVMVTCVRQPDRVDLRTCLPVHTTHTHTYSTTTRLSKETF